MAVPDFQHREPSGYVSGFTAHDSLDTQGYTQQYTGYSGHTPQFYHNDEARRFCVASPERKEPVLLNDVSTKKMLSRKSRK